MVNKPLIRPLFLGGCTLRGLVDQPWWKHTLDICCYELIGRLGSKQQRSISCETTCFQGLDLWLSNSETSQSTIQPPKKMRVLNGKHQHNLVKPSGLQFLTSPQRTFAFAVCSICACCLSETAQKWLQVPFQNTNTSASNSHNFKFAGFCLPFFNKAFHNFQVALLCSPE